MNKFSNFVVAEELNVPASSYAATGYFPCSGYETLAFTMVNGSAGLSAVDVEWSYDGVSTVGKENNIIVFDEGRFRAGEVGVKGRYFRFMLKNGGGVDSLASVRAYLRE